MKNIIRQLGAAMDARRQAFFCDAATRADQLITAGNRLEDEGRLEQALSQYRQAVRIHSVHARAHLNTGNVLLALKRPEEAVACYREAIRLDPGAGRAHFNLGRALHVAKRPEEAIMAYQQALHYDATLADAYIAMGAIHEEMENTAQAMAAYRAALVINPAYAEAHYNLGLLHQTRREPDSAVVEFAAALRHKPDYPAALVKLASAYTQIGFAREAVECLREARRQEPDNYAYHSHYLLGMNYLTDFSDTEVFAEHVAYGEKFGSGFSLPFIYSNDPDPQRRLRVGYVSGDFRQHPVLRFVELLLEKHCPSEVEVFCYDSNDKPDAMTAKLKTFPVHWRDIAKLDDDAAAALVRDDEIDILIDLSGHTGFQRLALFARKPAPVQATWLGYLGTTGLEAMDYRICDPYTDPPGLTEALHTERLARLPHCQWCYRPSRDLPHPSPLPMLTRGYITFGSFNNIAKLNEDVLALWARMLQGVPGSRLLIAAMPPSSLARERITRIFVRHGVDSDRLDFRPRQDTADYLRTCQEVDIALDPFPYNGGTTSIDLLCLGVPFIALAGTRSIARGGVTLLSNLGLIQLIAHDAMGYLDIAHYCATHADELATLRAALPQRVATSPLVDEKGFVTRMEGLYRAMWIAYVEEMRP